MNKKYKEKEGDYKILENRKNPIIIDRNTEILSIPKGTIFDGDAYFENCISLTSIPEGIIFNGAADFENCNSLTSIPEGTVFNGYANFENCISLTSIPEGTIFNGYANFENCNSLTEETKKMLKKMKKEGKIVGGLYL